MRDERFNSKQRISSLRYVNFKNVNSEPKKIIKKTAVGFSPLKKCITKEALKHPSMFYQRILFVKIWNNWKFCLLVFFSSQYYFLDLNKMSHRPIKIRKLKINRLPLNSSGHYNLHLGSAAHATKKNTTKQNKKGKPCPKHDIETRKGCTAWQLPNGLL